MKKLFLLLCLVLCLHRAKSQNYYETVWTSGDISYTGLLIYYEADDSFMRVKYLLNGEPKVAEFKCFWEPYHERNDGSYLLDGRDAKVVIGSTASTYSADNFIFIKNGDDFNTPLHIDDQALLRENPDQYRTTVTSWKQVSTDIFTEDYVASFFKASEPMYKSLVSYNLQYSDQQVDGTSTGISYSISELTFGNGQWAVAMSQGTGRTSELWRSGETFPKDKIGEAWDNDYYITNASYGDGQWAVSMSQGTSYTDQRWRTRTEFPEDEIKDGWDNGYYITELTYGNGVWALVMTKGTGYSTQRWRTRTEYPEDEIKKGWDEGFRITSLNYGDGKWALVMSKNSGFGAQIWRTRTYYPEDEIKKGWDDGYDISSLSFGDGKWALVMSKGQDLVQTWKTKSSLPKDWIQTKWEGKSTTTSTTATTSTTSTTTTTTTNPVDDQPEQITDATLHVVLVTNTMINDIGQSCEVDKNNAEREFDIISAELEMPIVKTVIDGRDFTKDNVTRAINNLNPGRNDVVVFIYSGHGFRWSDQSSSYPTIDLRYSNYQQISRENSYELGDIYNRIVAKGARLNIVIGDCCNSDVGVSERGGEPTLASRFRFQGKLARLRKLFLQSNGNLIVAAARPNETSCGNSRDGGYFLSSFFASLGKETSQNATDVPSWENIVTRSISTANYKTQNLRFCKPQNGIYYSSVK